MELIGVTHVAADTLAPLGAFLTAFTKLYPNLGACLTKVLQIEREKYFFFCIFINKNHITTKICTYTDSFGVCAKFWGDINSEL